MNDCIMNKRDHLGALSFNLSFLYILMKIYMKKFYHTGIEICNLRSLSFNLLTDLCVFLGLRS
jgi:hypothetical protein